MDNTLNPTYTPYQIFTMTHDFVDDAKAIKIIYELVRDEKNRYSQIEYLGMLHLLSIATA